MTLVLGLSAFRWHWLSAINSRRREGEEGKRRKKIMEKEIMKFLREKRKKKGKKNWAREKEIKMEV